jgi:hypothetical protein
LQAEEVLEVKPRLDSYSSGKRNAVLQLIPSALPAEVFVIALYCEKKLMCTAALYDPIDT